MSLPMGLWWESVGCFLVHSTVKVVIATPQDVQMVHVIDISLIRHVSVINTISIQAFTTASPLLTDISDIGYGPKLSKTERK
ncbi:hypothetical protein EDB87DRAFT_1611155 [Lactarius vividus]|nr:hypothetical protein EDB87DRAFT_1611155 [Lactarius vividus]